MKQIDILNKKEIEYIESGQFISEYPHLQKSLSEPRYTMKSLGVTPRDATYWDEKGVLPTLKTVKKTRRKYTLVQAVWIKLIQQLRSFEVSMNLIKKYKESILGAELNVADLIERDEVQHVLKLIAEKDGLDYNYEEMKNDPKLIDYIKTQSLSIFENMLTTAIIFKRDISFLAFSDGDCIPYSISKHDILVDDQEYASLLMKPHIVLSISEALAELISDWSNEEWFESSSLLTSEESEVIKRLRKKDVDELTVYKIDGKPERIEEIRNEKDFSVKDLANYIIKYGYQSIELKTRKGKAVSCKNRVSIKLNK